MNHVVYYIGGPWDQHKVLRSEPPKGWEEVAEMEPLAFVPGVDDSRPLKIRKHSYRIDRINYNDNELVYMARHEDLLK